MEVYVPQQERILELADDLTDHLNSVQVPWPPQLYSSLARMTPNLQVLRLRLFVVQERAENIQYTAVSNILASLFT